MRTRTRLVLIALLGLLSMPQSIAAQMPTTPATTNEQRVRDYVAAFNKRAIDTMLAMVTDDVQWLSIAGDKIIVESQGKTKLRESMEAQFKNARIVTSGLEWLHATASRVAVMERASWQSATGPKSQAGLAVYEFSGELISRVYYYPAEK